MRRTFPYLLKVIGIGLFVLILLKIDTDAALESIADASTPLLVLGFSLFPLIYAIKSTRWYIISIAAGAHTTAFDSMVIYMSGLFLGIATPGKVGEAIKIPALVSRGLHMKDAVTITILDRVFDIALLGLMGIWAIGLLFSSVLAVSLGFCLAFALGIAFLLKTPLRKLRDLILPNIPRSQWIRATLLTVLNWIVFFAQFWILALAFGIHVPLLTFIAIITITGIISILPIAPAGLGTRDAALLLLLGQQGVPAETIIAFSFTIFVLTIFASTIGAYFWLRYPLTHATK